MFIKSISLQNYRNYKNLSLDFDPKTNIFYGDNAQGKTNILESVYICGTTKSHKGSKDREIVRFGEEESHLGNVIIVCKKLLGIFWQTVAAVSERRIVVMSSDAWIQAYSLNDILRVKSFHFCVSIQFIEIRYSEGKIGVCKQLDSLCFCKAHKKGSMMPETS